MFINRNVRLILLRVLLFIYSTDIIYQVGLVFNALLIDLLQYVACMIAFNDNDKFTILGAYLLYQKAAAAGYIGLII